MLLALRSSRLQEICYLNIRYLIKRTSGYTFNSFKIPKTLRENKLKPPIKYLNFNYLNKNENLCFSYHKNNEKHKTL